MRAVMLIWVYWPSVTLYTGEVTKPKIRWNSGHTTDPEYVCLFLEVLQDAQCFSEWLRLEITDGPIGGDKIIRQFAAWEEQQHLRHQRLKVSWKEIRS